MKVVILAGGYGTRIRDVSDDIPKPMIPIGPYPILWHIMKIYSFFGHKDFIICLGYKGQVIKDFFLNYEAYTRDFTISFGSSGMIRYHSPHDESDWKITLVDTGLTSMTGSRISKIKKFIDEDDFLLTYGDGVSDVDVNQLIQFHKSHKQVLTVTGVRPPGRFGEMIASSDGTVLEFNEKPQATAGRISGGFFVANSKIFNYLTDDANLVFEQEPMRNLVSQGELKMYEHDGFWQPMDTSREYQLLNSLYNQGNAPWIRY
ncbi:MULTISPECIES: glucose-1-phosphate cytidylyltransferase [Leptospira]|uniref:Glucose-1-phosphate cytidylyltransferase n=1 Tax=Leptospira interrogans serovar Bataviae TaxID=312175 RepID=A0AAQ0B2F5_LEPIR|nr:MULTISPECIES: glucose-1-phosphate cytidylyltransferase [Leptospira]EMN73841.1 glucose-1-phosphate cytidylyltransferase [Leptospira interrogans serovar Bataviae str. UI 08561]EMO26168.1 glucose-1-phosphate cytidylyltransferase [Leptospira interrogans serovar Bataviae str. HAI135]EKP04908.1 glucose-1-phosphate cytidylyltransferase [Leptospira kirschneri str. 2008720114]EKR24642.1 glucose-1-phosphate cytidylyltransferase [Leptospira interrogans serovar Bataviae str. L1111]EKS07832.1 putative g